MSISLLPSPLWPLPICLDSWTSFPGSYAILFFTASDFTSITNHMHNWVLFLLWLCFFILSGVTFPLFSSSILGIYRPGEFIFQCPIFLPFHTVHVVLKAWILKWFAILFSSRPCFVRSLHQDPSFLGDTTWHGSWFHWIRQGYGPCVHFNPKERQFQRTFKLLYNCTHLTH